MAKADRSGTLWFCPSCRKVWGCVDPPVPPNTIPWTCDCPTHDAIRSLAVEDAPAFGLAVSHAP